jgi:hypothetical protein
MNPGLLDFVFGLGTLAVFPFWFLMIFAPGWRGTARVVASPLIIAAPAALYLALALPNAGTIFPALIHPSAASLGRLLGSPLGVTLAWLHFLAFDLFVGRWIYLDSRAKGLHATALVSPILALTLMLGPCGFVAYLAARWLSGTRTAVASVP